MSKHTGENCQNCSKNQACLNEPTQDVCEEFEWIKHCAKKGLCDIVGSAGDCGTCPYYKNVEII